MTNKKSAAEILASRGKSQVASRNDNLSDLLGEEQNQAQDSLSSPPAETPDIVSQWKNELEQLPKISNFMLRVESDIKEDIQTWARKQGITAETLIQGMWVLMSQNENQLNKALKEGKKHHQRRSRAAELKNLITRAEKNL